MVLKRQIKSAWASDTDGVASGGRKLSCVPVQAAT